MPAVLMSVQVGMPRWHGTPGSADPFDKPWSSGFFKDPVAGPVRVGFTNLDGDGQADLVNHGGPEKAVLAHPADHYPAWRAELRLPDLPFGAFGENLTIAGTTEADVCIGDLWRIGTALLAVTQPRQPCWKMARRWRIKDLPARVIETGRSGWYYRVLEEGVVEAGAACERVERPNPEWSVLRAHRVMFFHKHDPAESLASPQCRACPRVGGNRCSSGRLRRAGRVFETRLS
jgi:MOSC domain-containing protein YiiM